MQSTDLESLLRKLEDVMQHTELGRNVIQNGGVWVDLGCGSGLLSSTICSTGKTPELCEVSKKQKQLVRLIGVDYSPEMLDLMSNIQFYHQKITCDIKDCFTRLRELDYGKSALGHHDRQKRSISLFISNNAFHWLYDPEVIMKVLGDMKELLVTGGFIAITLAASGTHKVFLQTYKKLLEDQLSGPQKQYWKKLIENPIGLQHLDYLVDFATKLGLTIWHAAKVYQPVPPYDRAQKYVDEAMSYGRYVFLAPLLYQEDYNDDKGKEFLEHLREKFAYDVKENFGTSKYWHQMYTLQLILQKPPDNYVR